MLQVVKYRLVGQVALLLHNGQLADPLNPWSRALKEVTGKRDKTDADHEEAARLEWFGSLYTDNGKIVIPGRCVDATLINSAKKKKKGRQAKSALMCQTNFVVEHDGPEDLDELWLDKRFNQRVLMKVKGNGVMRTQPLFFPWATTIEVSFDDNQLNPKEIDTFVEIGGVEIGLCEGRPRYGRYTAKKL
jgi:hypothetical protein